MYVAAHLTQPTRTAARKPACPLPRHRTAVPIRSCSRWGLPCPHRCRRGGALLPHPFTLTLQKAARFGRAVFFLWHFPWGRPRRTLSGTVLPWSPDFPQAAGFPRGSPRPSNRL